MYAIIHNKDSNLDRTSIVRDIKVAFRDNDDNTISVYSESIQKLEIENGWIEIYNSNTDKLIKRLDVGSYEK